MINRLLSVLRNSFLLQDSPSISSLRHLPPQSLTGVLILALDGKDSQVAPGLLLLFLWENGVGDYSCVPALKSHSGGLVKPAKILPNGQWKDMSHEKK